MQDFARNARVVELLVSALRNRGKFFHDSLRAYIFLEDQRVMLPLERDCLGLQLLLHDYGLFPSEGVTTHAVDGLRLEAHKRGTATDAHAFSFFCRKSNRVYVYDFAGGIYRISGTAAERVDNGTDGVLFPADPRWTPIEVSRLEDEFDWKRWLLDGVEFVDSAVISDTDQQRLVVLWALTLFFPQLFPTRVILTMVGEKGSGKSSLLRRLGKALFGSKFDVTMLTQKPDDFDAAITTEPLVVADNADAAPRWFPDKLAVVSTGGSVKRRLLYTTNKLADFPVVANLAITSRTPNFRREDVAERLLPLNIRRIKDYVPEGELLQDVQDKRSGLLSGILLDVQRALSELASQAGSKKRTKFRMADFADFAFKVGPVVGNREQIVELLDRVTSQQTAFASEDEPLLDLLDEWLADESRYNNLHREIAVTDLGAELELTAGKRPLPWEAGSTRSFGQYFRNQKGTVARLYGMAERSAKGGVSKVTLNQFRSSEGGKGDLGGKGESVISVAGQSEGPKGGFRTSPNPPNGPFIEGSDREEGGDDR